MKKKILVVDDEEDIANLVKYILEPEGYEVRVVTDPLLAYDTIKQFGPDAILLDLLMRPLNGYEIFNKVRNDPAFLHVPIAILTAKTEAFDEMVGRYVMKADDYITKPFGKQELVNKINELFRKKTQ